MSFRYSKGQYKRKAGVLSFDLANGNKLKHSQYESITRAQKNLGAVFTIGNRTYFAAWKHFYYEAGLNRVNLRELDASCTAAAAVQRSENVSSAKIASI